MFHSHKTWEIINFLSKSLYQENQEIVQITTGFKIINLFHFKFQEMLNGIDRLDYRKSIQ